MKRATVCGAVAIGILGVAGCGASPAQQVHSEAVKLGFDHLRPRNQSKAETFLATSICRFRAAGFTEKKIVSELAGSGDTRSTSNKKMAAFVTVAIRAYCPTLG